MKIESEFPTSGDWVQGIPPHGDAHYLVRFGDAGRRVEIVFFIGTPVQMLDPSKQITHHFGPVYVPEIR